MAFEKLYALLNIAEDTFGNFAKLFGPLLILLVIFLIIKWIQQINKASGPDIIVMRRPS